MGLRPRQQAVSRSNVIEIAPLAYMRGRTLNHAFIILDEAQNTTPEQMKMFLTRIGIGAKAVVTGDVTQIDLPKGQKSGLLEARDILKSVRGLAFTDFSRTTWCATRWSRASSPPMNPTPSKRLNLSLQYACNREGLPLRADFVRWARAALAGGGANHHPPGRRRRRPRAQQATIVARTTRPTCCRFPMTRNRW